MKNSTLVIMIIIVSITSIMFYYFTKIMTIITITLLSVCFLFYLVACLLDYDDDVFINSDYNIFILIGRFFKWLDSKPRLIKPLKKKWVLPDDWNNEI